MSRVLDWLIRTLGGITRTEQEAFRVSCRDFATRHLRGRDFTIANNERVDCLIPQTGQDEAEAAVVGDYSAIGYATNVRIVVAPWVKHVLVGSVVRDCWFMGGAPEAGIRVGNGTPA